MENGQKTKKPNSFIQKYVDIIVHMYTQINFVLISV